MAPPADTAAQLLKEGNDLVAQIHALDGEPDAGPELLRLYAQLEAVVARARTYLGEPA